MRRDLYTDKNLQLNVVNHGHEPGEIASTGREKNRTRNA